MNCSNVRLGVACALTLMLVAQTGASAASGNLFSNPGFETRAANEDGWHIDKDGDTVAGFSVDKTDAAAGERSALVTIGRVKGWGTQFGQSVDAGEKGKTYTFAVLAKAVKEPVKLNLQIERRAKPYDRAAAGDAVVLKPGEWTEVHVTFKVEKDFHEGWFAYIECTQANCEYRADMFRLYEGDYVPYKEAAAKEIATERVRLLDGETEIVPGQLAHAFKRDACVSNKYLALFFRKGSRGPECYYRLGPEMVRGPTLIPLRAKGNKAATITVIKVIENKPGKIIVEAGAARYVVTASAPIIEAQPGDGVSSIRVEAPAKYAVLPDIFASDLVVSAKDAAALTLRFPSERMLLQLLDGGNAIVECVWPSREQQVRLSLEKQTITGSDITCSKEKSQNVWVAVLAAPAIWHEQILGELDPVKDRKLEWQVPFRALWRADYQRTDGLIDSWKCVIRKSKDNYEGFGITPKKSRTVWTSARGSFAYPACIEGDACFLRKTAFDGTPDIKYDDSRSALIYPYRAISGSPEGAFGAMDVLCDALQEDSEPQIKSVPRDKWPATCAVTADYEKVFDAGEEKAKKAFVLERLGAMNNFVLGIRSRMNEYLDWCKKTRAFCAATKAGKPQIAALVDELDGYLAMFDKVYQKRKLDERTPPAAHALIEKVVALIDSSEEKKDEKAKQIGRDTRTIGGSQDSAIGEFRMFTKQLRQRAGYRMMEAKDDAAFEFAREMRQRTMEMLQCAFGHESANTD